ncbi:uncharacterized protein LOC142825916 [Pelodiscus sinensis]|uniref:uncharacterized protein LOC142825913 n=1 Tax=Pelodiscus sinensis TaxID=13735 RepID=UPI003F6D694E
MAKHIRLWFRKALKMAPGPVGSSSSVPAGGDAESHQLGATRPPARPLRTWLQRRLGRRDPAQRGSRVGWLWGLLCGEKHLPQEPSPHYHQGASPCPAPGDLPVSGSPQPLRTSPCSCGSSSVSSSAWASSCSRATSCSRSDPEPPCASAELCQERMDSRVEEGAIYDIEEQLHTRDTSPAALQRFLLAVPPACLAALQRGEDTLAPRCCKDTMMARIVEIMEDSPPPLVLADCLNAACSLSTLQPPLQAQLLNPLLRAAVGQTVSGDWQQEPIHTQVRPSGPCSRAGLELQRGVGVGAEGEKKLQVWILPSRFPVALPGGPSLPCPAWAPPCSARRLRPCSRLHPGASGWPGFPNPPLTQGSPLSCSSSSGPFPSTSRPYWQASSPSPQTPPGCS